MKILLGRVFLRLKRRKWPCLRRWPKIRLGRQSRQRDNALQWWLLTRSDKKDDSDDDDDGDDVDNGNDVDNEVDGDDDDGVHKQKKGTEALWEWFCTRSNCTLGISDAGPSS